MKIQVLGVKHVSGIAKESKNPYSMATLLAVVPIEHVSGANFKVEGFGYEVGEMQLDEKAISQFSGFKFPCMMELTLEPILYRGKMEQIVTGTTSTTLKSASNG